jgi:hypothetical protein
MDLHQLTQYGLHRIAILKRDGAGQITVRRVPKPTVRALSLTGADQVRDERQQVRCIFMKGANDAAEDVFRNSILHERSLPC